MRISKFIFFLKNSKHIQIRAFTTYDAIGIKNALILVKLIFVRMEVARSMSLFKSGVLHLRLNPRKCSFEGVHL